MSNDENNNRLSPQVIENIHLPDANKRASEVREIAESPEQTGQWSAKPQEIKGKHTPHLPDAEADTMPGDTEVQSKTIWQRY